MKATQTINQRLEYLRRELRAERISAGELAELQSLAGHIAKGDVELLEAAGVPEFPESKLARTILGGGVEIIGSDADLIAGHIESQIAGGKLSTPKPDKVTASLKLSVEFADADDLKFFNTYLEKVKSQTGTVNGLWNGLACSALRRATVVQS